MAGEPPSHEDPDAFVALRERLRRALSGSWASSEIDFEEYLDGLAILVAARKGIEIPEEELRRLTEPET